MKHSIIILILLMLLVACNLEMNKINEDAKEDINEASTGEDKNLREYTEEINSVHSGWSDELVNFMKTINAEHNLVEKPETDWNLYDIYFPNELDMSLSNSKKVESPDKITKEQMLEDTEYLLNALSSSYSLYTCFSEFETAYDNIQGVINQQEEWSYNEFKSLLLNELDFIQDMHFYIDQETTSTMWIPCFYRETAYKKVDGNFYDEDGKHVLKVDGYDNLDDLFRRCLTLDGEVVYYPITFLRVPYQEYKAQQHIQSSEELNVFYDDGSIDKLTPDPYQPYTKSNDKEVLVYHNQDIPVFYSRQASSLLFSQTGTEFVNEPSLVVDLTRNYGGDSAIVFKWWRNYMGLDVPTNFYAISNVAGTQTMVDVCGFKSQDEKTMGYTHEDQFIENPNLTIILSGKETASGAELFIDMSHNVENTLVVGENTRGCLSSNQSLSVVLPNSGIRVRFGNMVHIFPENYFEEGYGFEPDLWCPASEAEEAAINFIKKNIQLSE